MTTASRKSLRHLSDQQSSSKLINTDGRGFGGGVKRGRGLRSTNWQLVNSYRGIEGRMENVVSNVVMIPWRVRWVLDLLGGSHRKVYKCPTTICTPETNNIQCQL